MKKVLIKLSKILGVILGIIILYVALGFFIPKIPVQALDTTDKKVVDIYILTNGVHTDLVVPVKNDFYDWTKELPMENTLSKRTDYKYLSVGWGDKGFYLDTPTWADLKFSTALKAAFWMSDSAMHCTYYDTMKEGDDCVKISITENQYKDLVKFIKNKFDHDANGNTIFVPTKAVYGTNDAFYDAKGKYSFLETCNTWANDGLKAAGQKAALWTPTDFGIFQHYRK